MMDGGDAVLSIPADSPMERFSPIHIVRAWLFLFLTGKHLQLHFSEWNWSVMSFYYNYRWMRWTLKVYLWKNRDFPTDEEECKSIKDEDKPLEPMRINLSFIPCEQHVLLSPGEISSSYGFNKYTALEAHSLYCKYLVCLVCSKWILNVLKAEAKVALIDYITKGLFPRVQTKHTHPICSSTWWRYCIWIWLQSDEKVATTFL